MKKISIMVIMVIMMFYSLSSAATSTDDSVIGGVLINDSITWYQEITADSDGLLSITVYFSNLSNQNITGSILDMNNSLLGEETLSITSGMDSLTFYWDPSGVKVAEDQDFIFSITGDGGTDMFTMLLLTGNIYDGNFYNSNGTSELFDMKYDMYIEKHFGTPVPLTSSLSFLSFGMIGLALFKRKR